MRTLWASLCCWAALAASGPALGADDDQPAPSEGLPDALPPLDPTLLEVPGAPPVRAFAQARLRGELDDSRDFARVQDTAVGATLTGRVGVEASVSIARALVVLGDGGRIGLPVRTPDLVPRPVAPALYQVELALDVTLFGLPGVVSFGRAPLVIADGRWVGAEPWDERGRSLDGARATVHGERVDAAAALLWFGPFGLDEAATEPAPSGLFVVAARARPIDDTAIDGYALIHRDASDETLPVTVPTLGTRATMRFAFSPLLRLEVGAGADVQGAITDQRTERFFTGTSGHAQANLRVASSLSQLSARAPDPFVSLSAEATGGDAVGGRSWRAPAPTQHGALGLFDFFAADNTWQGVLTLGGTSPTGLLMEGGARLVGVLDPAGPFVDPSGARIVSRRAASGLALAEGFGALNVPLRSAVSLNVAYAIGVPGAVLSGDTPAQRLLVTLIFAADSDARGDLPPLQ